VQCNVPSDSLCSWVRFAHCLIYPDLIRALSRLWYPTVQFTCKIYDPKSPEKTIWKSVNVSNFVAGPPGLDKRSCKADEFSITYKAGPPDSYTISARLGDDVQIAFTVTRDEAVSGWKVGNDADGGFSYFGVDKEEGKRDGYVVHRFWPLTHVTGHLVTNGKAKMLEKVDGMMVHAIQGMRPNLVASRWNFGHFLGKDDTGKAVAAIQMELTTLNTYGPQGSESGPVKINVGSLVIDGKLAAVTAETIEKGYTPPSDVVSRANHQDLTQDPDTGYNRPKTITFEWKAPAIGASGESYSAKIPITLVEGSSEKGLIEKVDVLAEIPYVIKMAVNYVAGTKPYIYQVCPATAFEGMY
jgi:hypothetical protein